MFYYYFKTSGKLETLIVKILISEGETFIQHSVPCYSCNTLSFKALLCKGKKKSLTLTTTEQNNFLREVIILQMKVNFIPFNYTLILI